MTDEEKSNILKMLSDEHTREILKQTMKRPMSADELSEECGISPQSIYRRTDKLTSYNLIETRMEVDPDGHHFKTYTASPTQVAVEITEESTEVTVTQREQMSERLSDFIRQVRNR